jgi:hypothetical protein
MENTNFDILLIEADTSQKDRLLVNMPHSKILSANHPYFEKRLIWTLTKRADTKDYPYEAIEKDERNGIRYQEILIVVVSKILGITSEIIKEKLNEKTCFEFDYKPTELDNLTLQEDYVYEKIKAINRFSIRGIELTSFTFRNGEWVIDEDFEKRIIEISKQGIVKINAQ